MLLVAMAYRDGKGKGVWASQTTLADDAGMSRASTHRHLKFLLGKGAIERDARLVGNDSGRATVMYRPKYPFSRNIVESQIDTTVSNCNTTHVKLQHQVSQIATPGVSNCNTNQEGNLELNQEGNLAAVSKETKDDGDRRFQFGSGHIEKSKEPILRWSEFTDVPTEPDLEYIRDAVSYFGPKLGWHNLDERTETYVLNKALFKDDLAGWVIMDQPRQRDLATVGMNGSAS